LFEAVPDGHNRGKEEDIEKVRFCASAPFRLLLSAFYAGTSTLNSVLQSCDDVLAKASCGALFAVRCQTGTF
jgi:hypothetical protein